MKLLNFTIIKLTLCLSVGILIAHFFSFSLYNSLIFTFGALVVLSVFYFVSNRQLQKTIWFGCLAFITTISIGVLVYNLHNQHNFKHHYSNYISNENESAQRITLRIREKLKLLV